TFNHFVVVDLQGNLRDPWVRHARRASRMPNPRLFTLVPSGDRARVASASPPKTGSPLSKKTPPDFFLSLSSLLSFMSLAHLFQPILDLWLSRRFHSRH